MIIYFINDYKILQYIPLNKFSNIKIGFKL